MLVWNPTNEQAVTLQDQATEMTCLAISADGKMVVSGGRDHVVQLWASNLVRLTDLPVGQIARDDWAWAQEMLRDKWLFDAERKWLEFIVALIRLRRQFDIELEERPRQVSVGEFDIELEDGPHRI
jgi:WD40 repeat protein